MTLLMRVAILGAGETGQYLAGLLSRQQADVLVVDRDPEKLKVAANKFDVATRQGFCQDTRLLEEIADWDPDLLLGLTDCDEVNLVACAVAKQLTPAINVARVHQFDRFLHRRIDLGQVFYVDHLISPEWLAAHELLKALLAQGALALEWFAHGAAQMRTFSIPAHWKGGNKTIQQLRLPPEIIVGLILRSSGRGGRPEVIFPHGDDKIQPGDEVTMIGEAQAMEHLPRIFDLPRRPVQRVTLVGGSLITRHLARLLHREQVAVQIIERDYDVCVELSQELPWASILHHDATDIDFLREQHIERSDAFICCTGSDAVNSLAAVAGYEAGCPLQMATIADLRYVPLLNRLNIRHALSPKACAANRILTIAKSETISSVVSLYEDEAEVMEVKISASSPITGIAIVDLAADLPRDLLFCLIESRGRLMVANGQRILAPGDTVIVIAPARLAPLLQRLAG
jgi:trk system potassium uptake protein